MKILVVATVFVLAVLNPVVYADEASQKVIAEDLLRTMKVDEMTKPLFGQVRSIMEQQFIQSGAPEDMKPILKKYTDKAVKIVEETMSWKNIKEDMISIYVKTFSEDELKGMLAFYKSPVGQSVINKMPAALQQGMAVMQKHMPKLQEQVKKTVDQMTDEIKAETEKRKKKQGKGPDGKK